MANKVYQHPIDLDTVEGIKKLIRATKLSVQENSLNEQQLDFNSSVLHRLQQDE